MTERLKDIRGFEYDWLACDADGHVGFFSTAGGGFAPDELLEYPDAYDEAIDAILAAPATTRARFEPPVTAGHPNTWKQIAERGLYAYDSDATGGPYRLVAAPEVAVTASNLPEGASDVIRRILLRNIRFGESAELTDKDLAMRE